MAAARAEQERGWNATLRPDSTLPDGTVLARIVRDAPVVLWATDPEGELRFLSDGFRRISGLGEWDRTPWIELLHADDRVATFERLAEQFRSGEPILAEFRFRQADGTYKWYLTQAVPQYDSGGVFEGYAGTMVDIDQRRAIEQALRASEARYRAFNEVNRAVFWTLDEQTVFRFGDGELARAYGFGTNEETAAEMVARLHPEDRNRVISHFAGAMYRRADIDLMYRLETTPGVYRWMHARGHPRPVEGNLSDPAKPGEQRTLIWYGSTEDIHSRREAELALQSSEERLALALGTGVGVWDWDVESRDAWLSASALAMQGYAPGELVTNTRHFDEFIHPDDAAGQRQAMVTCLSGDGVGVHEHRLRKKDGGWVWVREQALVAARDKAGRATRVIGTRIDISERKAAERRLRWLAEHDSLTGLLNRPTFNRKLAATLGEAATRGGGATLMLLDLDDFKLANDREGHDAGDRLLVRFADAVRGAVDAECAVARLGGDEFAVLCPLIADDVAALPVALALSARVRAVCQVSIGTAIAPGDGVDADTLLKNADIALYEAKARNRGGAVLYRPEMREPLRARGAALEAGWSAITEHRVVPVYHPRRSLRTGAIAGVEVLMRERLSNGTLVMPDWRGAAGLDASLAEALCHAILRGIAADLAGPCAAIAPGLRFALRMPRIATLHASATDRWLALIDGYGLTSARFDYQIPEDLLTARGGEHAAVAVRRLHADGGRVILDGFGGGHAAHVHLRKIPVDAIRLDSTLTGAIVEDNDIGVIARSLVGLGRDLGLLTIADGVTTPSQLRALMALACATVQGPLIAPEVSGDRLVETIHAMERSPLFEQLPAG